MKEERIKSPKKVFLHFFSYLLVSSQEQKMAEGLPKYKTKVKQSKVEGGINSMKMGIQKAIVHTL